MKCFQRTNVKKKSGEQELTAGTEVARKMETQNGRRLKWYWTMPCSQASQAERISKNTEQCREEERAGAREREKNRKIDSEDYRTSQINSCDEINVQPWKDIRIIHQVSHKRNQNGSYVCLGKIQNSKQSGKSGWCVDLSKRFSLHNFCCKSLSGRFTLAEVNG